MSRFFSEGNVLGFRPFPEKTQGAEGAAVLSERTGWRADPSHGRLRTEMPQAVDGNDGKCLPAAKEAHFRKYTAAPADSGRQEYNGRNDERDTSFLRYPGILCSCPRGRDFRERCGTRRTVSV